MSIDFSKIKEHKIKISTGGLIGLGIALWQGWTQFDNYVERKADEKAKDKLDANIYYQQRRDDSVIKIMDEKDKRLIEKDNQIRLLQENRVSVSPSYTDTTTKPAVPKLNKE